MKITKRNIALTINSFNNALFKRVETMSTNGEILGVFIHFIASDFALNGIKRVFGDQVIGKTSTGYYVDYTLLKRTKLEINA